MRLWNNFIIIKYNYNPEILKKVLLTVHQTVVANVFDLLVLQIPSALVLYRSPEDFYFICYFWLDGIIQETLIKNVMYRSYYDSTVNINNYILRILYRIV